MTCRFRLVIVCSASLTLASFASADDPADAFLDRPLPRNLKLDSLSTPSPNEKAPDAFSGLKMGSLSQDVQLLGSLSGKRIVLPGYLTAALAADKDEPGISGFWGVERNQPVRPIFNRICFSMGMVWRYEPVRDDIVLDLKWRRDDPRGDAELVGDLNREVPTRWDLLPWGPTNIVGGKDQALDPWRIAFDALLSKPENISAAGRVRIYHDSHGLIDPEPFPVINLLVAQVKNSANKQETLVLNGQCPTSNKESPCDVAYYLFDENGRFLKGCVYAMGEGAVGMVIKAFSDSDKSVTIDVGWGSFASKVDHAHFDLVNGDLVLQGATDSTGRSMTIDETRTLGQPPHWHGAMGVLKMSVTGEGI